MKKLKNILLILIVSTLFLGCDSLVDKPACEKDQTGSVKVVNNTGYSIYVDVTWGSSTYNSERYVSNGSSSTYNNVPAGTVTIWASFDRSDWTSGYTSVSSCSTKTYTWSYGKKSPPLNLSDIMSADSSPELSPTIPNKNKK